jgi:hypothetical protein
VRKLDTNFARYSVIFTGEKLPDGRTADGVYLIPTEPYREVLNNARMRPLNYDYLRELPPSQQRFYEIVSYQIFAALKHRQAEAKMAYSEYCTYSAQERYFDRARVQKQMYKVHRPHVSSGYLKSIRYQETTDSEGKSDWIMYYVPGPKARAEYHTFANAGRLPESVIEAGIGTEAESTSTPRMGTAKRRAAGPRQKRLPFQNLKPGEDQLAADPILAELTRRGIGEGKARGLLTNTDSQVILDQLEWGDHLIANARSPIVNPPGFYIHLLQGKIMPPEDFETSRKRKAREAARAAETKANLEQLELEEAYRSYRAATVKDHIATRMPPEDVERLIDSNVSKRRNEQWSKNLPPQTIREIAECDVRQAIAESLHLMSFEEFRKEATYGRHIGF